LKIRWVANAFGLRLRGGVPSWSVRKETLRLFTTN
jgi:hypothetical protein